MCSIYFRITMTQIPEPDNNMESLPKQFVSAMRTLFDIMDDKQTGYVKLTDIENRWRDDRTKGLPRGVIESLQNVTSPDGLLTFDRFCTGLKICLLKNQTEKMSDLPVDSQPPRSQLINNKMHRPPSVPLIDSDDRTNHNKWNVRKSNDDIQQRTTSMPQLADRKDITVQDSRNALTGMHSSRDVPVRMYGPPKPPRLERGADRKEGPVFKPEDPIQFPLKDGSGLKISYDEMVRVVEEQSRGLADGRPATEHPALPIPRHGTRRREPRRHTLHNGVDYNLLKRMKQIEQEKDVLMQGLAAVEEARDWYLKQLGEVQEKIRYASRVGTYVVRSLYFFTCLPS